LNENKNKLLVTKAKRYRAHGCKEKIVHLLKILLAGTIYFQNCPPAFSLNRWQQAFKKNLQLTYEIFNFVRNSI
jgi:hypothetical protein